MTLGFTTCCAYSKADVDWLTQLRAAVPLEEGRMEIVADWRATGAHFLLLGAVAVYLWVVIVQSNSNDWGARSVFTAITVLVTVLTAKLGRRTVAAWRHRAPLILSAKAVVWKGERLPWHEISEIAWQAKTLGGHSQHDCKLVLTDGQRRWVSLDQLDLPPRRVMLLIDYYWSCVHAALPRAQTA